MCPGAPNVPTNFAAYRVGRTIFVSWDSPAAGTAPTGYVVNVTGTFTGSVPTAGRSLSGSVGPGTYSLAVASTNACGTSSASTPYGITVP